MTSLFSELRRRNVFRVGIAYLIGTWLVVQVADTVLENIGAPDWVIQTIMLVLVLGFVGAVFFAWAFEVTPEGLKRESEVDRSRSITHLTGRKLDRSITALLLVALAYFVWESRFADREPAPEEVTEAPAGGAATGDESRTAAIAPKSIAVLPFDNRSALADDEFFTDGIHDDLLTTLAKIGSMTVISRTSVMNYRDTTKNIREIAQELGVANILEGGVQRAGNKVRINVQLIDAATDNHLWAEIYDRELTAENLFAIQSEISKAIAEALQATLSPDEQEKVEKVHTRNLEAYESYLLGRKLWAERTAESNAASFDHFQHAIDLDPGFALAYAGLSDAHRHSVFYGGADPAEVYPLARRAVDTALALDDKLGEAYAARGALKNYSRDFADAELDFRRAIELSPNHVDAYNWYAINLSDQGRFEEALGITSKALAIDPLSAVIRGNNASYLMALGRFDEALRQFQRNADMHPDWPTAYAALAAFESAVRGRVDTGAVLLTKALLAEPSKAEIMNFMAYHYMTLGDAETAAAWLDHSLVAQPDNVGQKSARLMLAVVHGAQDDADELAEEVYAVAGVLDDGGSLALAHLRDADIAAGRYDVALERYAALRPELVKADVPEVNRANCFAASDIAYLLLNAGRREAAERLLAAAVDTIASIPIRGMWGSWWGNAETYTMQGRTADALAELQKSVDAGVRLGWHYTFDYAPALQPLRDEPEFQRLRAIVAADIDEQLQRVRQFEAGGEIIRPENFTPVATPQAGARL